MMAAVGGGTAVAGGAEATGGATCMVTAIAERPAGEWRMGAAVAMRAVAEGTAAEASGKPHHSL